MAEEIKKEEVVKATPEAETKVEVKAETKTVTASNATKVPADKETNPSTSNNQRGGNQRGGNQRGGNQRGGNQRGGRKGGRFNNRRQTEFEEKVVDIARVTTVVKGGRRFSFSAVVVIGNKKGKVGWGHGKANEVPDAIRKAIKDARTNMIVAPIIDKRTVPHEQVGDFLASSVLVKPAPKGKGIIASGAIRSVVELAGYTDIYTKSLGSRSKTNSVKATIEALRQLRTIEEIAKLRDVKVEDIKG